MTRKYIGTKTVIAFPETKGPQGQPGYAVIYEDGYRSWSPKKAFEAAYRPIERQNPMTDTLLSFSDALYLLKQGAKVARAGWNGKGMYLLLFRYEPGDVLLAGEGGEQEVMPLRDYIVMRDAQGCAVPWLCSQMDALAEDWVVVE